MAFVSDPVKIVVPAPKPKPKPRPRQSWTMRFYQWAIGQPIRLRLLERLLVRRINRRMAAQRARQQANCTHPRWKPYFVQDSLGFWEVGDWCAECGYVAINQFYDGRTPRDDLHL